MGGADHVQLATDHSMVDVNSSRMGAVRHAPLRYEFEGVHVTPETVVDLKLNWLLILRGVTKEVSPFLCFRTLTVGVPG